MHALYALQDVPYDIYSPIVAIDVAAENATALPSEGRPSKKLNVQASHTDDL